MEAETFRLDSQREELVLSSAPQAPDWRAAVGCQGALGVRVDASLWLWVTLGSSETRGVSGGRARPVQHPRRRKL